MTKTLPSLFVMSRKGKLLMNSFKILKEAGYYEVPVSFALIKKKKFETTEPSFMSVLCHWIL